MHAVWYVAIGTAVCAVGFGVAWAASDRALRRTSLLAGLAIGYGVVAFVAAGVGGIMALERESCEQKLEALGLEGRWGAFVDCVAEVGGVEVPLDLVRVVEDFVERSG